MIYQFVDIGKSSSDVFFSRQCRKIWFMRTIVSEYCCIVSEYCNGMNSWFPGKFQLFVCKPHLIPTDAQGHERQNFQVWHWYVTPSKSYGHIHSTRLIETILVKSIWYILKICYVFIIAPVRWWKWLFFPNLALPPPPSPHTMLLEGGHFEHTDPTLVKLSKMAKCTMTFHQDCSPFTRCLKTKRRTENY